MALWSLGCKLGGRGGKLAIDGVGMGILSWRSGKFDGASSDAKTLSAEHFDVLIESFSMDSLDRSRAKFAPSFEEVLDALAVAEALPASRDFARTLMSSCSSGGWFLRACAQMGSSRRKQMLPSYARALGRHLSANELLIAHGRLVEPAHPELGFELTRVLIQAWIATGNGARLPRVFGHESSDGPRDPWSICLLRPVVFYTRGQCAQIASLLRQAAPAHEPREDFWGGLLAERSHAHEAFSPLEDRILGVLDAMPDRIGDPELAIEAVRSGTLRTIGVNRAGVLLDALGARGMVLDRAAVLAYCGESSMFLVDAFLARQEAKELARDADIRQPESVRSVASRL